MKKYFSLVVVAALSLFIAGCNYIPNADHAQAKQQEQLQKQANSTVGMPAIVNFQEKKILRDIYEMRDKALPTYTYITDMNGGLHKICDSVGYGIPYATQFTNPQVDTFYTSGTSVHVTMPQADPNGLFSPPGADGTWVLCKNPQGPEVKPVFLEPRIIVSQFPLK